MISPDPALVTTDPVIVDLEQILASQERSTPQHQFARAKLSAILGDIEAARASLQGLLDLYGDRLPDDDFTFISILQIALLTLELHVAADAVNRRFRTDNWFRVMFEQRSPSRVHVLGLRVSGRSSAQFTIDDQIRISDRFDVIVGRWIAVLHILVAYYRQEWIETGDIKINVGDDGEIPGLAFCESRPDYFLIPDPYYVLTQGYKDVRLQFARNTIAWEERLPVALWRGTTTGDPSRSIHWRLLPRARLCQIGREHRGLINAGLTSVVQMPDAHAEDEVRASGLMADYLPITEFSKFRYQIDIDGNTSSWPGLFQKLLTGCPVLKVASPRGFRQWYYERLKPWINFVPVATDMSDLADKIAWLRDHDDAARAIGAQGQALVLSMDYEGELMRAGRTVTAALRHFACQSATELRFGLRGVESACLQDGGGPVPLPDVVPTRQWKRGSMPVDLGDESLKDLFSVFRDTIAGDVFGPFSQLPAPGPQIGDVDPSEDTMAEFAYLLYSVKTAGDRYRLISLGAAPGEWALRAERSYRKLFPTGDYRSLNLEGDQSHVKMTQTLWRINNASLDLNVLRHAVIASQDGWAYFPKVNPDVDWGAALAAVSDSPEDLDEKISITDEARQQRINANGGKPLEFQTVPALSLRTLLRETGNVDMIHSDIQGSEADVFPPCMEDVTKFVRFCCVATHGRDIEQKLSEAFDDHGWEVQCAFPCRYNKYNEVIRDGTFIWSNPNLTRGPAKIGPSAVLRQLLTHHGTVVFLDIESGELRHGQRASYPGNVFIEVREAIRKGYLVHKVDDDRFSKIQVEPGLTPTPVRLRDSPSDTTQLWSLVSAGGGAVGLLSGDLYLCAEPDGRMTLSRQQFGVWEQFLPVDESVEIEVILLQTADVTYRPLLELTSQTAREYCARHRFSYESYFGIIRGYYPWHATYNRIPLLKRLMDGGYSGWVCYLDADAYVADLDFDLRRYLEDKDDLALIIAPGVPTSPWWEVNAGVFLINLGHPTGRKIVHEWYRRFEEITDDQLRAARVWSHVADDQQLLAMALKHIPDAEWSTLVQKEHPRLLNYMDGLFIKQVLRTVGGLERRATFIKGQVDKLLDNHAHGPPEAAQASESEVHEAFVRAVYRVLLLREPDPGGLINGIMTMQAGASFEDELRKCLECSEFAAKHRQFIETYVGREVLQVPSSTPMNNLTTLANDYGSDKGTLRGSPPHRYTYLYDLILDRDRNAAINFLELGLAVGGPEVGGPVDRQVDSPSVRMWLEYFPHAQIYGFDISDFSHIKFPRFTFVRGDSGSAEDLERLANSTSGFDIVIDDGSHASYHQQMAFRFLFPKLRPGGTYIIEDLHWQSPEYEGKSIALPRTRDFMIEFLEGGKYLQNEILSEVFMIAVRDSLASFGWFPAFSGDASPAKIFVLRKIY